MFVYSLECCDTGIRKLNLAFVNKEKKMNNSGFEAKSLTEIFRLKEESSHIILDKTSNFGQNVFSSDEEAVGTTIPVPLDFNDSDTSDDENFTFKNNIRRNRRKSLLPQKAVQLDINNQNSFGNTSESSQDVQESLNLKFDSDLTTLYNKGQIDNLLISDNENPLELPEGDDILVDLKEEDIFKDLQVIIFYFTE